MLLFLQAGNSPSSPRQVHIGGDRWYSERGGHTMTDGDHLANSYHGGSNAYLSRSAFMPMSSKSMTTSNLAIQGYHGQTPPTVDKNMSKSYSGDGGHWLQPQAHHSTSNLSDLNSSHSSGVSYKQHPAYKDHQRASYTEPTKGKSSN